MNRPLVRWSAPVLVSLALIGANAMPRSQDSNGPELAHMVFFSLEDRSEESRQEFVKSCHEYLSDHDGVVYFSVGVIAEDVVEPASVRDFDVALHLVFETKEAEQAYLVDPRHDRFVEENREKFAQVRVFDSYLTKPSE